MLTPASPSFPGSHQLGIDELRPGDVAIFGAPEATPYTPGKTSHSAKAPAAIRQALAKFEKWTGHYDFDVSGPMIAANGSRIVDLGDVAGDPSEPAENRAAITAATTAICGAGGLPVVIGGDDSVPIPLLAGFDSADPFWVVQIDAHIDWRDERSGVRLGWSSTMRRASEMPWVEGIVQAGIRGPGSARPQDVKDAESYGAAIITAREIHARGIKPVIEAVPEGARCFVTIDCDGLDPSVIPAILSPAPGGLTYWHMIELIETLAKRNTLIGCDLIELVPERDVNGLGALTAGRIICNLCTAMSQSTDANS